MLTAAECKRSGDLCNQLAHQTSDKLERAMLKQIADQWRRLANYKAKKRRKAKAVDVPAMPEARW
jgi:hypothetical protein